jgi:hypothetical protein
MAWYSELCADDDLDLPMFHEQYAALYSTPQATAAAKEAEQEASTDQEEKKPDEAVPRGEL